MKEEHEGRIELTDWKEKWRGVNEKSKEGKKIRQEEVKENNKIKKTAENMKNSKITRRQEKRTIEK